ncbi:hypothetical protein ACFL6S_24535, partial [Candidatus Poribacteria bacterium]
PPPAMPANYHAFAATNSPAHGPAYDHLGVLNPNHVGWGAGCLVEGFEEVIYDETDWGNPPVAKS